MLDEFVDVTKETCDLAVPWPGDIVVRVSRPPAELVQAADGLRVLALCVAESRPFFEPGVSRGMPIPRVVWCHVGSHLDHDCQFSGSQCAVDSVPI